VNSAVIIKRAVRNAVTAYRLTGVWGRIP